MRIEWIDGAELCVEPPAPQEDRLLSQNAILDAMNAWDWQELYLPIHFKQLLEEVPPAQPETANIIVGKSRNGTTMWYQCDNCNEPVDENDLYCRGCGRRFEHESN